MKPSEFEEREYEAPLYVQLQHGSRHVWSPGQVLEAHVGFDYALFTHHPYFWSLQGFVSPLSGVVLGSHSSDKWWPESDLKRPLPDFSLNLFIQAKRPFLGTRATAALKSHGIKGPYWKFSINHDQQLTLESLAQSTHGQALVCYACAAFHRVSELWAHSRTGSIVETSTFPTASSLRGHEAWYYKVPGCEGVANPTPELIRDLPLFDRIDQFISQQPDKQSENRFFGNNLQRLATAVNEAISEDAVGNSGRTAVYFEALREIDRNLDYVKPPRHDEAIRNFLAVAAFTSIFQLQWHVLAPSKD